MAGLEPVPETPDEPHDAPTASRNARIGLVLFVLYSALYGSFMLLNAFAPDVMDRRPYAGVNLAVLYGFGLIVAAFVLALLYGFLCRNPASDSTRNGPASTTSTQEESP